MKNRFVVMLTLVLLAFASVSMADENLPQSEVDEIVKGVENGDADAQLRLGMMYQQGQNVKKDDEQAFYWFKKSYEQGNVEAQCWLAGAYAYGNGTKRDEAQAFKLFKQVTEKDPSSIKNVHGVEGQYSSAEELIAVAQYVVGTMYYDGRGVQKDYEQAEYWLKKSLEHGSSRLKKDAQELLDRIRAEEAKKSQTSTASTQPKPQSQPSASSLSEPRNFNEAKGNAAAFLASVEEVAKKLMKTESYNTQDSENNGDETLYMRSWYSDRYFMFCYYANRPRPVATFRTYSPEFTFAGGIKVGSSFSEIRGLFGDFSSWSTETDTLDINVDLSEANIHITNGKIDYIEYNHLLAEYTHKMSNLLCLYRGDIYSAGITANGRLNIRDSNGTHGNILFQVTNQNNILFVDTSPKRDSNGNRWYRVRFAYDKSANTISSVNEGYVMGKYINVEPLGYEDRQSLITAFSK